MPVDKKLALEYLQKLDPSVYEVYTSLRKSGMTIQDIESRRASLCKLSHYYDFIDQTDMLESVGAIETLNDYENGQILVKDRA